MSRLVKNKSVFSLNPFYSARDVLLALVSFATIALIVWILAYLFSSSNWSMHGGIVGAIASVLISLFRLLPISGKLERSTRNEIIKRLSSLNYVLESSDKEGNLHFRREGHVLARWDSERATIFVNSGSCDRIVAPFGVMYSL